MHCTGVHADASYMVAQCAIETLTRIWKVESGLLSALSRTASGVYFCMRLQTPFSICSCSYAASHTLQNTWESEGLFWRTEAI